MWFLVFAAVGSALNPRLGPIQTVTLCEGDSPLELNCPGAGYDLYVDRSSTTVFWGRRDSSTCAPASPGKNLEMCEGSSDAADKVRYRKNTVDLYFESRCCPDAGFVITVGTIVCRYGNPRCQQRQLSWHLDNSCFSRCMSHQVFTLFCCALLCCDYITWWCHQTEAFSTLLAICAGNSPVTDEFPSQRPVTRSFDVFLWSPLNKQLSIQSWGWWFDTPYHPLWRHCNDNFSVGSYDPYDILQACSTCLWTITWLP